MTSIVDTIRALFAQATRRQRHLDRPRLARRHPRRRLRRRDRHLPSQVQLRPSAARRAQTTAAAPSHQFTELDLLNVVEVPRRAWHGIDQLEVTGPDPLIPRERRLWQAVSSR